MSLTLHKVVGPWKGCRQLPLPRAVPQRGSSFKSRRSEGCFETSSICRASLIVTTYPYPLEARVSLIPSSVTFTVRMKASCSLFSKNVTQFRSRDTLPVPTLTVVDVR